MLDLNEVRMFVQVVRARSFAAAARRLGVPPNTLSRRVRQLESGLDTRLLQRSTRKLTLTAAGAAFFERCAPADFLDFFRFEWVSQFLQQYPKVRLDFVLSDARADLITEGVLRIWHFEGSGRRGDLDVKRTAGQRRCQSTGCFQGQHCANLVEELRSRIGYRLAAEWSADSDGSIGVCRLRCRQARVNHVREVNTMVQGKWNILLKTPVGDRTGVLDLQTDGSLLTGSLSDAEHFAAITDGKVVGNKLTWSAKITKPMKMNFKFTATVEADCISGAAKHLLGSATFTGTRAQRIGQ